MSLCMGCPIHAHFAEKINILQLSKCVYHHVLLQEMACLQQPLACCKSNRIQSAGQSAMSDHLWYVMLHGVLKGMMETAQPACQADTVPSAGQARHRCMRKRQHSVALMSHLHSQQLGDWPCTPKLQCTVVSPARVQRTWCALCSALHSLG
jgi:hypothetical protein